MFSRSTCLREGPCMGWGGPRSSLPHHCLMLPSAARETVPFPYTTLFRSIPGGARRLGRNAVGNWDDRYTPGHLQRVPSFFMAVRRSEERRGGKESLPWRLGENTGKNKGHTMGRHW